MSEKTVETLEILRFFVKTGVLRGEKLYTLLHPASPSGRAGEF